MTTSPTPCPHPDDAELCRQALVKAWREQRLAEHCVLEGLRQSYRLCSEVLLSGLSRNRATMKEGVVDAPAQSDEEASFQAACQTAALLGYQRELSGAQEVFVEAFHQMVRYAVHKFGFRDEGTPSADDVYQDVFMGLHQRLRAGVTVEAGRLPAYVWQTAVHACLRAMRSLRPHVELAEEEGERETSARIWPRPGKRRAIESRLIEAWEQLDWELTRTDQGDLINRIIVAHKCLAGQDAEGKPPVKEMLSDWRHLAKRPDAEIDALYDKVLAMARRRPLSGVVLLAGELINAGTVQGWQMPVVFAAGTGLGLEETRRLVAQLGKISDAAVYTRISRLCAALQPSGGADAGGPETVE